MVLSQHHLKQAVFTGLLLCLIAVLESKAAIGAYHSVIDHIAAYQHAALSCVCSLLAFFTFGFAGRLKDDERRHVAARAKIARIIAICFLLVPIGYLGSAFKQDRQAAHWAAYSVSQAYQADVALAHDPMADRSEREDASQRIVRPTTPDLQIVDGEWWLAAFFQVTLILASDALRVPAPITPEEREHQRRSQAARKAAATRKARKSRKPSAKVLQFSKPA